MIPCTRLVASRGLPRLFAQTSIVKPFAAYKWRPYSSGSEFVEPPEYLDAGERKVFGLLKDGLNPLKLEVQDISGGCGSTYALDIVSDQFTNLSILQQHRLVKKVLAEEFKRWHGIQLKTKAP